ncbi:DUF1553 domain-containing protein [Stieleria sp. TO1_6]|uniref:DUF1553 domain-containing protein n=1 Tax=Stieleria tagensis TaxID=2956795 RepID=UPI00209B9796|nr:DUF1553 domain-containing protein [Stieleria tagensis]MCO8122948.1 DUF1553 domain-containing protein [Stieleria tagensis]
MSLWLFGLLMSLATTTLLAIESGIDQGGAELGGVDQFDRTIAPLLAKHCLGCHSGDQPQGELDLSSRARAIRGGESGAALVPGDLKHSLLWDKIESGEMPPEKDIPEPERDLLRRWIESGAAWGSDPIDPFRYSSDARAGNDWWSLQPIKRPPIPNQPTAATAIDAFVQQRLQNAGLPPSPSATPREIIRRISFDLLGLPPEPSAVTEFQIQYERDRESAITDLVERMLASKHYGERWARHWLDVARFGESQGYERDHLRNDSWHYRDWVIDAFNRDMPYDQFVRLQLAGDVIDDQAPQTITATGFLVAGPWDAVGQSLASPVMKAVVRQDEMEDYVGTIGQAFLGLTINCARCHDHKFDPITQEEYYRVAAALAGVHHGSRQVSSAENRRRVKELADQIREQQDAVAALDATVRDQLIARRSDSEIDLPPRIAPIARWEFRDDLNDTIGGVPATAHAPARIADGRLILDSGGGIARTESLDIDLREKTLEAWVKLDNLQQTGGAAMSIHGDDGRTFDAIVYAERESQQWMAGSDLFKRTQSFSAPAETQADQQFVHVAITWAADGSITGYRNGEPYGVAYQAESPLHFEAGTWYVMFGLRCQPAGPERQLSGLLETAQLYDRALSPDQVKASYVQEQLSLTHDQIIAAMTSAQLAQRESLLASIEHLQSERQRHRPYTVYAVKPKPPEPTHLLARGNPGQPIRAVAPGGIAAVTGVKADFAVGQDANDADRRGALADWIANDQNPLLSRVIVNRIWHHHFGSGLVNTPNDFGFSGGHPSHPELLDYLAAELVDNGFRLKHIHRLIVTSETYLQSSRPREDGLAIDGDNRLLWRKSPQRLDAETLRDTILAVSGELNRQFGGPPYRDFTTFVSNSQFYEMVDIDSPDVYRRTLYRTWIRSGRNHMLDVFDCPDPSTTAPKRSVTTTPLQALTLMNNSFVLRMADRFASRVQWESDDQITEPPGAVLERIYRLAYGRSPADDERATATEFIESHGLSAYCRVILNSNEFIYVD